VAGVGFYADESLLSTAVRWPPAPQRQLSPQRSSGYEPLTDRGALRSASAIRWHHLSGLPRCSAAPKWQYGGVARVYRRSGPPCPAAANRSSASALGRTQQATGCPNCQHVETVQEHGRFVPRMGSSAPTTASATGRAFERSASRPIHARALVRRAPRREISAASAGTSRVELLMAPAVSTRAPIEPKT